MDILITGSTGFLGKYLIQELSRAHRPHEIVRDNISGKSNIVLADLATQVPKLENIQTVNAIVHCAGLAHFVPKSSEERDNFFKDNVAITSNLLLALDHREQKPSFFVFISTVAVYGLDRGEDIDETFPLNAQDAYGLSKIESERIIKKWCDINSVTLHILRLPLVAGDEPPGNLGAMISALRKGYYVRILGVDAKRSIVLAKDVASVTESLLKIRKGGVYNLTDDTNVSFRELELAIREGLSIRKKTIALPLFTIAFLAKIGDVLEGITGKAFPINSIKLSKLTSNLTFSSKLAREELKWQPMKVLQYYQRKKK